ncbi:MAG: hypothetical protein HEP71_03940 [Roseivirga sp.]|nr:hypothetical protein [Roseivirga sp.]
MSLLILSVLCACSGTSEPPKSEQPLDSNQQIISLSDIHFDPFFDNTLYPVLAKADIADWDSIFNTSSITPTYLDPNDNDTNWFLYKSTLNDLKTRNFDPPFLIITGDLLLHNMQRRFDASVSEADRLSFTIKTMDFVYLQLESVFPDTPIYAALGNNDNFMGNYSIEPGGDFLEGIADTWYRSIKANVDSVTFYQSFLANGSYEARVNNDHKILSLNTILFFDGYPVTSVAEESVYTNAITSQLIWLRDQLEAARATGQKVWLIYHIPPGADVYKTVSSKALSKNWTSSSNQVFLELVREYQDVITAQFGGHTHKDSFALIQNEDRSTPISFIHTTPSISMSNRNYPGYHHIKVNADFEVLDYDAYFLSNAQNYASARWEKEYSFLEAYDITSYTPESLWTLREKLNSDTTLQKQYINFFNVSYYRPSSSPNISAASWKAYWCAMGNQDFAAFEGCWK